MKVFELTHVSEHRGYSPGTDDYDCCWQTFTAFCDCDIKEIGIKLQEVDKNAARQDYLLQLCEYDPVAEIPGVELARAIVLACDVENCKETKVSIATDGLVKKRKYALVLSLAERAGKLVMPRYRWLSGEPKRDEQSGGKVGANFLNTTAISRGLWLNVYYDEAAKVVDTGTVTVDITTNVLRVGESVMASAVASDNKPLIWKSVHPEVASIDSEGVITALAPGQTKIVAKAGKAYGEFFIGVPDSAGMIAPFAGMKIATNIKLKRGTYSFRGLGGIEVVADNITIDGNGAWIESGNIFSGQAIALRGRQHVVLENIILRGFHQGILADNCSKLLLKNCDCSKNFSDPSFGWGDGQLFGGIIFSTVTDSVVENCRGEENWNGMALHYSHNNLLKNNNFSHCTNVCLKLWNSCNNTLLNNNFSHGIRLSPGEVHARDATSVLIESGSDNNKFLNNDCTFGGDGIFIRALNGWPSVSNYFENNDCSYANNNGFESWCEGNVYVRNKANYCSYGFWLGGSDNTVMIGNEAAYNGCILRNAPEAFGNAGVAVVNGSSSHFSFQDNYIHNNNGPGLAVMFAKDYPAYHWVIQNNRIVNNRNVRDDVRMRDYRGHGIYLKNATWINISGNDLSGNEGKAVCFDENVANVFVHTGGHEIPHAEIKVSQNYFCAGNTATFTAVTGTGSKKLQYRWEINGVTFNSNVVDYAFAHAGFYRVALSVTNGAATAIAYQNVFVLADGELLADTSTAEHWTLISDNPAAKISANSEFTISGSGSIFCYSDSGTTHELKYVGECPNLTSAKIAFALRYHTEVDADWSCSNKKPLVRLYQDETNYIEYTPQLAHLEMLFSDTNTRNPRGNEFKLGWQLFEIAVDNPIGWEKAMVGAVDLENITALSFTVGPKDSGKSWFWLDGVRVVKAEI
ncbi:MAG: right-handed parallel beta-helix repeat-containing protein [Bacillota bacterium]